MATGDMTWTQKSGFLTNNVLSEELFFVSQPLLRFRQFVDIKKAFGKNSGESVNYNKVSNVGTLGGTLAETSTMNETKQAITQGTLTVSEYGNSIPFTGKIESLSEFDIKQIIRDGLVDDMVKVIDGAVEAQFNSAPLRYVGTTTAAGTVTTDGTATATNTSVLNSYHVKKMRLELEKRNVAPYDGEDYVMICSLEALEGLETSLESVNQYTEAGYKKILNGEVGRMHGVRFVKDGWASRNTIDLSARTSSEKSWSTGNSLSAYMFGKTTIMEAVACPEEIRMKVVTDYGRSKGLAWYFLGGWDLIWTTAANSKIIVWDSAA